MNNEVERITLFAGGGVGWSQTNVTIYLASGIAVQKKYIVDFVTLNTTKEELAKTYGSIEGFADINVYPLGVSSAWKSILPLANYYRHYQPKFLFSQLTYFNAIAIIAKRLSGAKTLNVLIEGTLLSKMIGSDSKFSAKLMLVPLLAKITYPQAQGFIAKSQDILADVKGVVGGQFNSMKSTVLPNPYPFDRFKQSATEPTDHPWLSHSEIPVIVSSGRLCEQKGFDVLIQAFANIQSKMPCRLLILGEGPDRPVLESMVRQLGLEDRVDLPGRVPNPWKYVKRATVFVLASRWEGWPSALMEAMALDVPVITTDCPGDGKKFVKHGENGLLIPMNDVAALEEAMLRLLSNPLFAKELVSSAQKTVVQYDYRGISKEYTNFAETLVW